MSILEMIKSDLKRHKKSEKDIKWVGSEDGEYAISWNEFVAICEQCEPTIWDYLPVDFVVVGTNFWYEIETDSEDDMQRIMFKTKPKISKEPKPIKFITRKQYKGVYCVEYECLYTIGDFQEYPEDWDEKMIKIWEKK